MANYNINAVTRRVVYTGSAGVGPYAFSFEILTQTDVDVYFNDTLLTITTDYTVTINANGTGSVTIVTGTNVPTTPDADDQITIVGARDIERVTDFVTAGDFRASAINEQLDALTIFDQQLAEADDRTVKAPVTDPTSIDMTLPKKADRASKLLLFSATGDVGVASTDTLTVSTLQAFTDYQVDTFTGDNTTVAFTLSAEPGQKGNTQVYFDGVYQAKANYSLVGTSITFTTAPATGVKVEVVHGQAASTYTPDDGSITFAKLATAAVDTDLTGVSASHDTLPTALATKTYVDAQIGANNELSEVLANGNTSGGTNIVVSAGDSITTDTIAETTAAAGVTIDGVLVKDGEVDGRDVSVDGTKLDTVETNADVTDTANVTAAGALMDSELTNIAAVKALDQGVATTDTPTFAGVITAGNVDGRDVSVDGAKLDGIEAGADVTDTANVTAAGALMDSELTNIAAVKALDQGVATTDSPSFAGLTATTADINGGTIDGTVIGGASAAAGTFTTFTSTGIDDNASSTAITIDSSGQVGIGTTPSYPLHVKDTQDATGVYESGIVVERSAASQYLYLNMVSGAANIMTDVTKLRMMPSDTLSFTAESGQFYAENAAGPAMLNEAATSTNPTLVPNRADADTGIGWAAADALSLITGGTEGVRIDSSGNVNIGDFTPPTITGSNHVYLDGSYGIKGSATTNNGIYFARHDSESTVRRMMALVAGSNNFVIGDSDVGYVQLNVDGTARFRFDTTSLRAEDAAGPALLNEAATSTNPTLVPNRARTDDGISSAGDGSISAAMGGGERVRFGGAGDRSTIELGVFGVFDSTGLAISKSNSYTFATDVPNDTAIFLTSTYGPTSNTHIAFRGGNASRSYIYFGDTNDIDVGSVSYDHSDDSVKFVAGAASAFSIGSAQLAANDAAGPTLMNEAASSTNPTLVPNKTDTDTGIGSGGADNIDLIAGGSQKLTINANTGSTGGSGSAGAGNQYVELLIAGNRYKLLHDGTI